MMPIFPEFLEAMILFVASGWLFNLYTRAHYKGLLFASVYLLFPAMGLLLQSFDASPINIEFSKWVASIINIGFTIALIRMTWDEQSSTSKLLVKMEWLNSEIARMRAEAIQRETDFACERAASCHALYHSNSRLIRELLEEVAHG